MEGVDLWRKTSLPPASSWPIKWTFPGLFKAKEEDLLLLLLFLPFLASPHKERRGVPPCSVMVRVGCSVVCCWVVLMCEGWHALVASFTLSLLTGWLHSKMMRQARILYTAGGEWVVSVCSVDLSSWVCEQGREDYQEAYIGLKSQLSYSIQFY